MTVPLIVELSHEIYPLLVASAVAIAFVTLVISFSLKKDFEDNDPKEGLYDIPDIPQALENVLKFTRWGLKLAAFLVITAVVLLLLYVYPVTSDSLLTWSFNIVVGTYGLIFLAFIVPVCVSSIIWLDRFIDRQRVKHKYESAQKLDYKGEE